MWDCEGSGAAIYEPALGGKGKGKVGGIDARSEDVPWTLAYDSFGETYTWFDTVREGRPEEVEAVARFWAIARDLLERGVVKPIRQTINLEGSGLDGVMQGLKKMRAGKVSAEKLVYTM